MYERCLLYSQKLHLFDQKYNKTGILFQLKITLNIFSNVIYSCDGKVEFSAAITPVTWNHSNMLICCSTNYSYYYQCWKQLCCLIFMLKLGCIFQDSLINRHFISILVTMQKFLLQILFNLKFTCWRIQVLISLRFFFTKCIVESTATTQCQILLKCNT